MSLKKRVNKIRGVLTRSLTRYIGTSVRSSIGKDLQAQPDIRRILICRPNHRLGNLLLTTPLVQEVRQTFPNARIDLFIKGGAGSLIFRNYKNINTLIQLPKKPFKDFIKYLHGWLHIKKTRYDIAINVVSNSSSGRLSTKYANAKFRCYGDVDGSILRKYPDADHMAKFPVYSFRNFLTQLGFPENNSSVAPMNLALSADEIAHGKKLLTDIVRNERKTIALFTYATGDKCYTESWWQEFYTKLKAVYPDYNIIEVLPVENISQLAFSIPSFYSKDVREIGSFITNTDLFIGADSGMMHLASATHTTTVGLFKVTNTKIYAPYNHNSLAIDTSDKSIDECIRIICNIPV
jgi:ADP-heptose:LPS heptosyltransferase